ncbi:hypothetical protein EVAR_10801_1 [Eumeta japonica]|uniref:Uncharacterized protein n=1 Tax=Eumeta variegata TaxID=151549 RepID=A0A4C1Y6R1_EUMVA|nr:hypothetical protein EVAR_10801_1 [Eumeta japonica]
MLSAYTNPMAGILQPYASWIISYKTLDRRKLPSDHLEPRSESLTPLSAAGAPTQAEIENFKTYRRFKSSTLYDTEDRSLNSKFGSQVKTSSVDSLRGKNRIGYSPMLRRHALPRLVRVRIPLFDYPRSTRVNGSVT